MSNKNKFSPCEAISEKISLGVVEMQIIPHATLHISTLDVIFTIPACSVGVLTSWDMQAWVKYNVYIPPIGMPLKRHPIKKSYMYKIQVISHNM